MEGLLIVPREPWTLVGLEAVEAKQPSDGEGEPRGDIP